MGTPVESLRSSYRHLRLVWRKTSDVWRDALKLEFDERIWQPLDTNFKRLYDAARELDRMIEGLRKDVS